MSDIGVKNLGKCGVQVLNVGQIFIEKMPKNAQRRLIF